LEALGINGGYFLVQVLNFLILFVVLSAWVYRPVLDLLEKRRETIAQGLEDARIAEEARANAEKEAEKIMAEAQAEASKVVSEATERAASVGREIRAEMEAEAAKAKESALAEAKAERDRMLADVRGQIAALAMAATQKLVGETLDDQRQHALIDEFFSGIKAGKVTILDDAGLAGDSVEVISALPLTDEEQAIIKKDIFAKVGEDATVELKVDPSILGGLVIRVGDKVLDNSVAAQMEELRSRLG